MHRYLGRTGVKVSPVALGTMAFGSEADEANARAIFGHARDAGINFVDTADVYGSGRSEEILGRLLQGCRDEMVLASKAYFPTGAGPNDRGTSRYHLVRAVEASLRRLATDRIDVYYLHRFDDDTALDETLRAVDDLVTQGKILYPACSNFAAWQIAHANGLAGARGTAPLVAVQPMYNLVKRQAEVEILPMAAALGLGVVTYSPTAGGLLTGKYGAGRAPEHGRLVENKMYQTRYGDPALYQIADAFTAIAGELGVAPAKLAVAWVLAEPRITSVLVGGRTVEQLRPTIEAMAYALPEGVHARISALVKAPPPATDRNEEATRHNYGAR